MPGTTPLEVLVITDGKARRNFTYILTVLVLFWILRPQGLIACSVRIGERLLVYLHTKRVVFRKLACFGYGCYMARYIKGFGGENFYRWGVLGLRQLTRTYIPVRGPPRTAQLQCWSRQLYYFHKCTPATLLKTRFVCKNLPEVGYSWILGLSSLQKTCSSKRKRRTLHVQSLSRTIRLYLSMQIIEVATDFLH